MKYIVYTYAKCSTCRNATAWLREQGIDFEERPIREMPPSKRELEKMLALYDGGLKKIFNTSGMDYRAQNMAEKLPKLKVEEALALLHQNGNLVKRPFLLSVDGSTGLVGFKPEQWTEVLSLKKKK